jgi:CelD/BcsL family acetyltransferase involved in cellulose biosynthesis
MMREMTNQTTARVTRLHSLQELEELQDEWNHLYDASHIDNIFLTHPWIRDWWKVYGNHHDLWLLVATRGGTVRGIAPLMLERSRDGMRRLAFIGDGEVLPNELDVIARPDDREGLVRAFWFYLWQNRAEWDLVDFQDTRKDSAWLDVLASESTDRGLAMRSMISSTAPYVALPSSFEEYLQGRGKRTRADFRAQGRRLARDFQEVRFACVKTATELEVVFEAFVRLHQARWNERGNRERLPAPNLSSSTMPPR